MPIPLRPMLQPRGGIQSACHAIPLPVLWVFCDLELTIVRPEPSDETSRPIPRLQSHLTSVHPAFWVGLSHSESK